MNTLDKALQYAEDVRDGKIVVGNLIKLAIARHYRDLEQSEVKGWYFSDKAASKALRFFDFLVLTKSVTRASVPKDWINADGTIRFELSPWNAFMIASIYGWKITKTKKRRFTEVYLEVAKKNAKSTLGSGIANYALTSDNEAAPEVYFGAFTRDQANICFEEAVHQIKNSRELRKLVTILTNSVTIKKERAKMRSISHDKDTSEGLNASLVMLDEYHTHDNDGFKNSLSTGQSNRPQPLLVAITTAGFNKQGPCFKHREILIGMLEGKYELDHIFTLIYTIDEGDDWRDEANWVKANPNLEVTTFLSKLRQEFSMALRSGSKEVDFKTKRLSLWTDAATTWIPAETWNACADPDFEIPIDAEFYGGIDLGRTNDITSVARYYPAYNYLTVRHYCAEDAAKYAARGGIDYQDWINAGHLIPTPGKTTDYGKVEKDILDDCEKYEAMFIGLDRFGAQIFKDNLRDALGTRNAPTVNKDTGKLTWEHHSIVRDFPQGYTSLSPPTKLFEELILNGTLRHDGNPVTAWMLGNVVLDFDSNDNMKPNKAKSKDKIDGIAASVMALGEFARWDNLINSDSNNKVLVY